MTQQMKNKRALAYTVNQLIASGAVTSRVKLYQAIATGELRTFTNGTRQAERITTWDEPEEIIKAAVNGYRKNYWSTQPEWIEVWSEKGTIRGTLAPVLDKYGVTFRVMHGYGSATSVHGIAEETARSDKRLTVLYVGDWDASGMNMSAVDLPSRMARYEGDADCGSIAGTAPGYSATIIEFHQRRPSWRLRPAGFSVTAEHSL